jgi:hypothetical protein
MIQTVSDEERLRALDEVERAFQTIEERIRAGELGRLGDRLCPTLDPRRPEGPLAADPERLEELLAELDRLVALELVNRQVRRWSRSRRCMRGGASTGSPEARFRRRFDLAWGFGTARAQVPLAAPPRTRSGLSARGSRKDRADRIG